MYGRNYNHFSKLDEAPTPRRASRVVAKIIFSQRHAQLDFYRGASGCIRPCVRYVCRSFARDQRVLRMQCHVRNFTYVMIDTDGY